MSQRVIAEEILGWEEISYIVGANPQNYGAGTAADQILHVVHSANFIDSGFPGEGNILMFNNGDRSGSQNDYSSVEEITAPLSGYTYTLPYNQSQHWFCTPMAEHFIQIIYQEPSD